MKSNYILIVAYKDHKYEEIPFDNRDDAVIKAKQKTKEEDTTFVCIKSKWGLYSRFKFTRSN
jgi:hypothetical protein